MYLLKEKAAGVQMRGGALGVNYVDTMTGEHSSLLKETVFESAEGVVDCRLTVKGGTT